MHGEGGGPIRRVVVGWGGGGGGGGGGGIPVYTIQLGSSRHPRALRVRSTIQLTSIVTKGMKSSEIDVVINNGDDDDDNALTVLILREALLFDTCELSLTMIKVAIVETTTIY